MLIGDVARRSGVSARMLRHYESLGLVRPTGRTGSGYREYSDEDIRRIFHIESLRSLGLSLREVGRALDDPGFAPAELVAGLARRTRERIAAETELLTRLHRIGAAEPAGWEDVLRTVALLQALGSKNADARQRAALATSEEAALPVEALVEAVLDESDPNVAGALRWALARAGENGPVLLAEGLDSPAPEVRERAVRSLAELPGEEATALLRDALAHPDATVRGHAAVALGAQGSADAIPTLVDLVVGKTGRRGGTEGANAKGANAKGANDVDAADALSALADDPALADRIAGALVDRLALAPTGTSARRRLTQALADIPGPTASRALGSLSHDEDPAVALTARYVLALRDGR
ncbi:HEAT repeat domain-containing protein [Streptomyces bikiniensis]|uniref:HEAT repeat domain-containing protein n=1 Tax=Streptomyces bikiniensis TaxID=1896 RepID=A0ABW8CYX6_STRBI